MSDTALEAPERPPAAIVVLVPPGADGARAYHVRSLETGDEAVVITRWLRIPRRKRRRPA